MALEETQGYFREDPKELARQVQMLERAVQQAVAEHDRAIAALEKRVTELENP